jgi:7-cyano-7-deazaguanine synthase in queuosine biosynthesis
MLNQLTLSLQFDALENAAVHRAALPRHKVARWIRHALGTDAAEGQALIIEHTHTSYPGDREHRHACGYGCGECPACLLRALGYERFAAALWA